MQLKKIQKDLDNQISQNNEKERSHVADPISIKLKQKILTIFTFNLIDGESDNLSVRGFKGGEALQRCWVHKTCNILDKLPKSKQPSAKK
tara:strand:- start:129 stop:398 length:270 start_codon:yes stop_codon:yes gene_type:complete